MSQWMRNGYLKPVEPTSAELAKSEADGTPALKGWVEGFMSTEEPDVDGDIILADGIDIEEFLRSGFWCYEHPSMAHTLVGRSTEAWVDSHPSGFKGLKTRGYFYLADPMGKMLYEKASVLAKTEHDETRHLAWSVEGKGVDVEPRKEGGLLIKKSKIHTAAVTHRPKNGKSRFVPVYDIAASLADADERGELIETLEAVLENRKLVKSLTEKGMEAPAQDRHILKVLERFPHLDLSAAKAVVGRIYQLLG